MVHKNNKLCLAAGLFFNCLRWPTLKHSVARLVGFSSLILLISAEGRKENTSWNNHLDDTYLLITFKLKSVHSSEIRIFGTYLCISLTCTETIFSHSIWSQSSALMSSWLTACLNVVLLSAAPILRPDSIQENAAYWDGLAEQRNWIQGSA